MSQENLDMFERYLKDKFEYMDEHADIGVLHDYAICSGLFLMA